MAEKKDDPNDDPMKWIRRAVYLAALVIGWLFILWQNKFFISPPAVFVCLAYLAVVSTVYALWRTGVVAVTEEEGGDSTWGRSLGAVGELEREKKTLLKAIKEAEFDREMGKLSKSDADEMIGIYRARAIEVIRELDNLEAGAAGTVREQIEREVRARLEIESKTKKAAEEDNAAAWKKPQPKKDAKKAAADAAAAAVKAAKAAERAAAAATAAATPAPGLDDAAAEAAADAAADQASAAAAEATEAAAEAQAASDELEDAKPPVSTDDKAPTAKEATS